MSKVLEGMMQQRQGMSGEVKDNIPKSDYKDNLYDIAKISVTLGSWLATIAGLPVGGVPSAFFSAFIKQPVEERWKEWAESVIERLIEVEYKVEDLKKQ